MEVTTSSTPAVTAGALLSAALRRYHDKPVLLMLSGGSAFALLEYVDETVLGPQVMITTLDERFATDPAVNNFAQLSTTDFFRKAAACGAQSISTMAAAVETLEEAGERFDLALTVWREQNPDGVVLATMGIGPDGHTAGIFPGEYNVNFSGQDWVVAYQVPKAVNPYPERITVTYTFLREQLTEAIVYAVGAEKSVIIKQLQQGSCDLDQMPACIVRELPSAIVVTDQKNEFDQL